jgi:hypothetical protein
MRGAVWIGLSLFAYGLGAVQSSQAATTTYLWRTLEVGIELESSGDLLITETQSYDVAGKQALRLQRTISLANVDRIADIEVFENQQALAVNTGIKDEQFHIRWRAPRQPAHQTAETRTFVVRYRVQGGVRVHPSGDQIAWPALFGGRETPLPQGAVTLRVPADLAGEIRGSQSYGVPATIRRLDARTMSFVPSTELQPDETLQVKVVVPHGRLHVTMPNWQRGIDVPYTLPGILGQIDTTVLIVVGVGLFACLFYAISSTTYGAGNDIDPAIRMDRYAGTYQRVLDRAAEYEKRRLNKRNTRY